MKGVRMANNEQPKGKNPAAVELSKLGASKGGIARAASLSKRKRVMIARNAAKVRWSKNNGK